MNKFNFVHTLSTFIGTFIIKPYTSQWNIENSKKILHFLTDGSLNTVSNVAQKLETRQLRCFYLL